MLQVTNTTMKKTTLTILVLLILALGGCGDAYKANNSSENNNTIATQQTDKEYFQPPISLIEVVERIPNDSGITSLRVVESDDRELTVAFKDPYYQIDEVIENYQNLRNTEFEGMISTSMATLEQLQRDQGIDHSVYMNALNKDIEDLQLLLQTPVTGEMKVKEVSYAKR